MGVFILCWLPFFVTNILMGVCPDSCISDPELVLSIVTWLGWLNSGMNPVIYACWSRDFRRAFKKILCSLFLVCSRSSHPSNDSFYAPTAYYSTPAAAAAAMQHSSTVVSRTHSAPKQSSSSSSPPTHQSLQPNESNSSCTPVQSQFQESRSTLGTNGSIRGTVHRFSLFASLFNSSSMNEKTCKNRRKSDSATIGSEDRLIAHPFQQNEPYAGQQEEQQENRKPISIQQQDGDLGNGFSIQNNVKCFVKSHKHPDPTSLSDQEEEKSEGAVTELLHANRIKNAISKGQIESVSRPNLRGCDGVVLPEIINEHNLNDGDAIQVQNRDGLTSGSTNRKDKEYPDRNSRCMSNKASEDTSTFESTPTSSSSSDGVRITFEKSNPSHETVSNGPNDWQSFQKADGDESRDPSTRMSARIDENQGSQVLKRSSKQHKRSKEGKSDSICCKNDIKPALNSPDDSTDSSSEGIIETVTISLHNPIIIRSS